MKYLHWLYPQFEASSMKQLNRVVRRFSKLKNKILQKDAATLRESAFIVFWKICFWCLKKNVSKYIHSDPIYINKWMNKICAVVVSQNFVKNVFSMSSFYAAVCKNQRTRTLLIAKNELGGIKYAHLLKAAYCWYLKIDFEVDWCSWGLQHTEIWKM